MHELFCITNRIQTNITPLFGSLSWRSNTNELGDQLDFDMAFNDAPYFPKNPVDLGSLIVLKNTDEILRGFIITEQKNGRNPVQYTVFDHAFYLNKSKAVYQFNKVAADQAITKILTDFKVPIGKIAGMKTLIKKIYPGDQTVSDIIKDIMDIVKKATGVKYVMEMRQGKLYIEKQTDMLIKATFSLATNFGSSDVMAAISNPSRKRSIDEMRNSIKITSGDDSSVKVVATAKNDNLIKQYGLLQEVQSIDKKDIAQAKNIAANMLKDLGKIFEDNSIEVPGDDRVRSGRILEVTETITGMSGNYVINDVTHTVKNGFHSMQLGLGVL